MIQFLRPPPRLPEQPNDAAGPKPGAASFRTTILYPAGLTRRLHERPYLGAITISIWRPSMRGCCSTFAISATSCWTR